MKEVLVGLIRSHDYMLTSSVRCPVTKFFFTKDTRRTGQEVGARESGPNGFCPELLVMLPPVMASGWLACASVAVGGIMGAASLLLFPNNLFLKV